MSSDNNNSSDGDADDDDDVIMSGQFSNAGDVVGSNFVIITARAHAPPTTATTTAHDLSASLVVAALKCCRAQTGLNSQRHRPQAVVGCVDIKRNQ